MSDEVMALAREIYVGIVAGQYVHLRDGGTAHGKMVEVALSCAQEFVTAMSALNKRETVAPKPVVDVPETTFRAKAK